MYAKAGVAPLSEHQVRRLIKGQGVSIKAGSKHAIPMSKEQMKKFERAKKAGKGMIITLDPYQQKMCGGGAEEVFRDMGKYLQPTFDAAQDRAMHELRGSGAEEVFRDMGKYLQPTFDAAQDRAIREIGRGKMKGKGAEAAALVDGAGDFGAEDGAVDSHTTPWGGGKADFDVARFVGGDVKGGG